MVRYNFDRIRRGKVMAEGIAVHANNLEEATAKAKKLMRGDADSLRFIDNEPCVPAMKCAICQAQRRHTRRSFVHAGRQGP